jgi:hypothetical protein
MKKEANVSLILAERIIELFDEVGASEAERYCAVNLVAAMIPVSVDKDRVNATSTAES